MIIFKLYGFTEEVWKEKLDFVQRVIEETTEELDVCEDALMVFVDSDVERCDDSTINWPLVELCCANRDEMNGVVDELQRRGLNTTLNLVLTEGCFSAAHMNPPD